MLEVMYLSFAMKFDHKCTCTAVRTDQICERIKAEEKDKVIFVLLEENPTEPGIYRQTSGHVGIECKDKMED